MEEVIQEDLVDFGQRVSMSDEGRVEQYGQPSLWARAEHVRASSTCVPDGHIDSSPLIVSGENGTTAVVHDASRVWMMYKDVRMGEPGEAHGMYRSMQRSDSAPAPYLPRSPSMRSSLELLRKSAASGVWACGEVAEEALVYFQNERAKARAMADSYGNGMAM